MPVTVGLDNAPMTIPSSRTAVKALLATALGVGVAAALALWLLHAAAEPDLQRSHIESNVPPAADFDRLLQRDLRAYFNGKAPDGPVTAVDVQLLRAAPTQSGTSFPKFYLWVKARAGAAVVREGAVRVVAMERIGFEVTDFVPSERVRVEPDAVRAVFPAALVPAVLDRAGAP